MQSNLVRWKAAAVAAVMVLAAACGNAGAGSGHTSPPASPAATSPPRASADMCKDAAALRTSLENIVSFQAGKDPVARLRADLADAGTKLAALSTASHDRWGPQIAALETSLKKLRSEAINPSLTARPAGIERALRDVGPKARSLFTALNNQCPQL